MRNPLVLVHGIDDTALLFRRLKVFLENEGWPVFCLDLVPNNGDAGLGELAQQLRTFVQGNLPADRKIDLIGFSMGGLVARYYVQRLGGIERVDRLVTISAPHQGTWTGFLRGNTAARQMRPASAFLQDLNKDADMLNRIRFSSLWSALDLMIVPATSSRMPMGRSYHVPVLAHPFMVTNRRVFQLIRELLR